MSEPPVALLMFVAYRNFEQRIFEHLAAEGFADITLAQGRLAARIAEEGSRLTDLAEQAQITKQSAGFLIDALERGGYVERVLDPSDARARLVRLAARGRKVQRAARRAERAIEGEWTRHLGATRMRQLRETLVSLREITDPWG